MATARMSRERLCEGDLPRICVKTGAPADGLVEVECSTLPAWTYLLLLGGIVPFFIALIFASETIRGQVPVHRVVFDRYRRLNRQAWLFTAVAAMAGVTALLSDLGWVLWWVAGAAVIAAAVTFGRRGMGWIDARPVRGTSLVELRGVSPEFAAAVEAERANH
jgi:hypothetical protein